MEDRPELEPLREKLAREEAAYAECLAALDKLAGFELPAERLTDQPGQMAQLNQLWPRAERPAGSGLSGAFRTRAWDALAADRERAEAFRANLVRVLNGHLDEAARIDAHLREVVAALIRYLQRVLPLIDARDRVATGLAVTHAELILEAFDRRLERLERRLGGLEAIRDRLETLGEEVAAVREGLRGEAPPPAQAAAAERAADGATYVAFENRFRGDADELAERLAEYVPLFEGCSPVLDLGCGSGVFLEQLRSAGLTGRGVDANARAIQACRDKGLDAEEGDLVAHLEGCGAATLGGVFAAQVAEHLEPPVLQRVLAASHRALRGDGRLVLETVNVRSVTALVDVYVRDLTHARPLHPETLRFMVAAAGFSDVRVELRHEIAATDRLREVPVADLPPGAVQALNENVTKLNELLFAPLDYAVIARR